jgi:hypothetical protein
LQIGLSMQVEVDTHERTGDRLPQVVQSAPTYATDVFHSQDGLANERVRAIIAANEPGAAHVARSEGPGAGVASNRLAGDGTAKPAVAERGKLL